MIELSLLLLAHNSITQSPQPAFYQPANNPAVMVLAEVDDEEADKPKPKRRPARPKAPAAKLTTPTAPLPYLATTPAAQATPDAHAPALAPPPTVSPAATALPPVSGAAIAPSAPPPPPVASQRLPDPVPPPERIYVYPLVDPSTAKEISLRCDTLVFAPDGTSTRGIVRLSLIPSRVNPDEYADIHVMAVDIGHASLIRNTICEAYRCSVAVTPTFYALTVVDKRKSEIKITLNRQTGAFYGYERQADTAAGGLITLKKGNVVNETGWCVPEAPGKALF
jgi:hypothetical protein